MIDVIINNIQNRFSLADFTANAEIIAAATNRSDVTPKIMRLFALIENHRLYISIIIGRIIGRRLVRIYI
jgi:hypothetical protein